MSSPLVQAPASSIVYPDTDGLPMAENTKQLRWIVVLFGNLAAMFRDALDIFVSADLFWYPLEGFSEIRMAPDVLVVFGRPKGDRTSYMQWEEQNVPITVVFEVLSPSNSHGEMLDKLSFYEEYGVEEYYVYDPERNRLEVYVLRGDMLFPHRPAHGHISPRLGIRFDLSGPEMIVYRPDGQRFLSFEEMEEARLQAEQRTKTAEQRTKTAEQRAETAEQRANRLAYLSRRARRQEASSDELAELDRLEESGATPFPHDLKSADPGK